MYSCGTSISEITENLENGLSTLLNWFYANDMVANPDKFQLMFLELKKTSSTENVKLLEIEIYHQLRFISI